MCEVISLMKWKRARLGTAMPICRRARPNRAREAHGFVQIGEVSSAIVRRIRE